jgi:Zn-finger nucleic acid-binding protein
MRCRECRQDLHGMGVDGILTYACGGCHGLAITNALLRRCVPKERFHALWRKVHDSAGRRGKLCPSCGRRMSAVDTRVSEEVSVELDGCRGCQLVWFDAAELERFSPEGLELRPVEKREKTRLEKLPISTVRKYHGGLGIDPVGFGGFNATETGVDDGILRLLVGALTLLPFFGD